ncbi:MAG: DUF2304 domain-containing protein [Aeromicrobium sp.]
MAASAIILVTLFDMLRRNRLREKYAVWWFVIAVASSVTAVFPALLAGAAKLLNVQVPSNLAFFLGSLVLLAMSLQHSVELGKLEAQTRTLAEEVAMLRLRLDAEPGDRSAP